jgi:hypothetical protein
LPHTDFCFSASQVKQLVGLNRSNDVSTLRAAILIHQLSDDVKPSMFSSLLLRATRSS